MREIKFRGLHLDGSGWAHGYYTVESDIHYIEVPEVSSNFNAFEVKPETVGQFTGLKDKNGVEIYEGDIVIFADEVYIIQWMDCGWMMGVIKPKGFVVESIFQTHTRMTVHSFLLQIIGNIHEHPHLLTP